MRTIKTLTMLIAGLSVLASCNKETINAPALGPNEICFGSRDIRIDSRAFAEANNNSLQANGFKVAAVLDDDSRTMFNAAVTYDSEDGVYRVPDKSYYFPLEGTVSFYGVYPASQTISVGNHGVTTIAYTQNADTDLVVAQATEVARQSEAVMMTFRHLLSQITIKMKGDNAMVNYNLRSVTITNASGGTYSFADDSWTRSSTTADYSVYNNDFGMSISTSGKTDVGGAMSFIPGDISLRVVWDCYNKYTPVLISSNDQTVDLTLSRGKNTTLNLTLPSNSTAVTFTTSIQDWEEAEEEISMEPVARYAVTAKANEPEALPDVQMSAQTKMRVSWGDSTSETFINDEDQIIDQNLEHVYKEDFSGDVTIYVDKGEEESIIFTVDETQKSNLTVLTAKAAVNDRGTFTVSETGKKVKFSPANLYWNGSDFAFEEHQYDFYIGEDPNHISYFGWNTYASIARAGSCSTTDPYDAHFAENGGAIPGYTMLTSDEWKYLLDNALARNSSGGYDFTINGKTCFILRPDRFYRLLSDTYSASEWQAVEEQYDLVALPFGGMNDGKLELNSAYYSTANTKYNDGYCAKVSATNKLVLNTNASALVRLVKPFEDGKTCTTAVAKYTHRVEANKYFYLPELKLAPGTKVKIDWGDSTTDFLVNKSYKAIYNTQRHLYSSDSDVEITVYIEGNTENAITFLVRNDQTSSLALLGNGATKKEVPYLFSYKSTNNGLRKHIKVTVAPGNLYWNGEGYAFEEHAYDYPTTMDPNHIGYFFWSKTASVARAETYNDSSTRVTDVFFADNCIPGYTGASLSDWGGLFRYMVTNSAGNPIIIIAGKKCAVLNPSQENIEIADQYSAEEWEELESRYGLVALPYAGARIGSSMSYQDEYMYYWISSTYDAWDAYFIEGTEKNIKVNQHIPRSYGMPVRLIQIVDIAD